MLAPPNGDDWVALSTDPLDAGRAGSWAVLPSCGAVVVFSGTVRDHAEGRPGVTGLEYEAYEEQAVARLAAVAGACRDRWPEVGRLVLWHRTGAMGLGEVSVVVAASTPHRASAFEAARWCIDTLKETVPIWKHETWGGGDGWGTGSRDIGEVPAATEARR